MENGYRVLGSGDSHSVSLSSTNLKNVAKLKENGEWRMENVWGSILGRVQHADSRAVFQHVKAATCPSAESTVDCL
jgi:hypothetical protein